MRAAQQISIFSMALRIMASPFCRYLDHTQRHTTAGMTPLKEWSTRGRDFYLQQTTRTQTSKHATGGIRAHNLNRQTYALERAATGTGK